MVVVRQQQTLPVIAVPKFQPCRCVSKEEVRMAPVAASHHPCPLTRPWEPLSAGRTVSCKCTEHDGKPTTCFLGCAPCWNASCRESLFAQAMCATLFTATNSRLGKGTGRRSTTKRWLYWGAGCQCAGHIIGITGPGRQSCCRMWAPQRGAHWR